MSGRTERDRQYTPKSPEKVQKQQQQEDKSQLLVKRVQRARLAKPTSFAHAFADQNDNTTTTTTTTTNTMTDETTSTSINDGEQPSTIDEQSPTTTTSTNLPTKPTLSPEEALQHQTHLKTKTQQQRDKKLLANAQHLISQQARLDKIRRFQLRNEDIEQIQNAEPIPDIFRPPIIDATQLHVRDVLGMQQQQLSTKDIELIDSLPPIKTWEKNDLKHFKSNFYIQSATFKKMDPTIIRDWYLKHHVSLSTITERKEVLIKMLAEYLEQQSQGEQLRFEQTKQFATELLKAKYIRLLYDLCIINQFKFEKLLLVSMNVIDKYLLMILEDYMIKIANGTTGQTKEREEKLSFLLPHIITYLKAHPLNTEGETNTHIYYGDKTKKDAKEELNGFGLATADVDLGLVPEHIAYSDELNVDIDTLMERTKQLRPCLEFTHVGFPDYINEILQRAKFTRPTPVQSQSWPVVLSGKDLIGIAPTGSGKTLAYLLPAIIHLNAQKPTTKGGGPIVLIIGPTVELISQIYTECHKLIQATSVKLVSLHAQNFEKVAMTKQFIRSSIDILIGTPTLIIKLLSFFAKKNTFNLNRVTYLILDEADILAHNRTAQLLCQITDRIRPDRQTVLYSASWTLEVESLLKRISPTKNPYFLQIGNSNSLVTTVRQLTFFYEDLRDEINEGVKFLLDFTTRCKDDRILVFVSGVPTAERAVLQLRLAGIPCGILHHKKSSAELSQTLKDFRASVYKVLVATDIAARGLDITDLQHVLNIGLPTHAVEFIHRVGRVGRAGKRGIAYNIIAAKSNTLFQLQRFVIILRNSKQDVPHALELLTHSGQKARDFVQKAKIFKIKELQSALDDVAMYQEHTLSRVHAGMEQIDYQGNKLLQIARDSFNPLEEYDEHIDDDDEDVRTDTKLIEAMKKDSLYKLNNDDDDDSDAEWWEQVNRVKNGDTTPITKKVKKNVKKDVHGGTTATMNDNDDDESDYDDSDDDDDDDSDDDDDDDSDDDKLINFDPDDESDFISDESDDDDDEPKRGRKSLFELEAIKLDKARRDQDGNIKPQKEYKTYTYEENKAHKDSIHEQRMKIRENEKIYKQKQRWKETAEQDAALGVNMTTKSFDVQFNERQAERNAERIKNKYGDKTPKNGKKQYNLRTSTKAISDAMKSNRNGGQKWKKSNNNKGGDKSKQQSNNNKPKQQSNNNQPKPKQPSNNNQPKPKQPSNNNTPKPKQQPKPKPKA